VPYKINLNLNDPCPCGSDKLLRHCCRSKNGKIKVSHVRVTTPGRKTGYCNPRCYGAPLGDCSQDTSGEHYITHGVLKKMSRSGNVEVNGFPWQLPEEWKSLPAKTMTSNILCSRHNKALSLIDDVAIRFLGCMNEIDETIVLRRSESVSKYFLFNGYDLERWMLKTLCGIIHSKNASLDGQRIESWSPPKEWLQVLFENKAFEKGTGMYFCSEKEKRVSNRHEFQFTPFTNDSNGIDGAAIQIRFLRFIMAMTPVLEKSHFIFKDSILKPSDIIYKAGAHKHAMLIWWMHKGENIGVEIDYKIETQKQNH
jgi:hypothetical protein